MDTLTQALFFKGMASCGKGDYSTALECLNEGLELARFNDKPRLSRIRNTLGWLYHDLCDIESAIAENDQALEFAAELGDPETISFGHLNLADCYLRLGQLDEAEAHLKPVIRESTRDADLGDKWMRWRYSLHLHLNQGRLALRRGQHEAALRHADDCVAGAAEAGSTRYVGRRMRLRGAALAELGRIDEAGTALDSALEAAREVGNPYQLWRTLAALSRFSRDRGRTQDGVRFAAEAISVIEAVAAGLGNSPLASTMLISPAVADLRASVNR